MQQLINGNSVPISAQLLNSSGAGVTGATVLLSLRDRETGYYFNSSTEQFEAGYRTVTMTEVDAVNAAGLYLYNFDNPGSGNDVLATITTAAVTAINKFFQEWYCYRAPAPALTSADVEAACEEGLADYGAATGAAIAALNNVSSADVEAACGAALVTYDGPTKAELDAGLAGLNDLSTVEIEAIIADLATQEGVDQKIDALNDLSSEDLGLAIATGLVAYDVATRTDISALNDLSTEDVENAANSALSAYDPPTKAELDAGLLGLNDLSSAEVEIACSSALASIAGIITKVRKYLWNKIHKNIETGVYEVYDDDNVTVIYTGISNSTDRYET